MSEIIRLGNACRLGKPLHEVSDTGQVSHGRMPHRVCRFHRLQEHINKGASFEVVPPEPLVEYFEYGEQPLSWSGGSG